MVKQLPTKEVNSNCLIITPNPRKPFLEIESEYKVGTIWAFCSFSYPFEVAGKFSQLPANLIYQFDNKYLQSFVVADLRRVEFTVAKMAKDGNSQIVTKLLI